MGSSSSKKFKKKGKVVIGMNRVKEASKSNLGSMGNTGMNEQSQSNHAMITVGNDKLSDLRMQLLKTGVIKVAIMCATERDGIPKEIEMFTREFLPPLLDWCMDQGFELVITDLQQGNPTAAVLESKEYLELSMVMVEDADIVIGSLGPDNIGLYAPQDEEEDVRENAGAISDALEDMFDLASKRFPWVKDYAGASLLEVIWRHAWVNVKPTKRKPAMFFFRKHSKADESKRRASKVLLTAEETEAEAKIEAEAEGMQDMLLALRELIKNEGTGQAGFASMEYGSVRSTGKGISEFIKNQLSQILDNDSFAEELMTRQKDEDCYAHIDYLQSRMHARIGRVPQIRTISDELLSMSGKPVVGINGIPGSGKSSMIVAVANDVMTTMPNTLVHLHFCAASPGASSLSSVVARAATLFIGEANAKAQLEKHGADLATAFQYALKQVCLQEKKVILILDGMDEIKMDAMRIKFLPAVLPQNFRLLVSFSSDTWAHKMFKRRTDVRIFDLGVLSAESQREMIRSYFKLADGGAGNSGGGKRLSKRASFSGNPELKEDHLAMLIDSTTEDVNNDGALNSADDIFDEDDAGADLKSTNRVPGSGEAAEAAAIAAIRAASPLSGGKLAVVRATGTLFEVKMAPRDEFNQVYQKRGVSSSWQIYLPLEPSAPKCTIKCVNGTWEMRDADNQIVYVNDMDLDTPPQLGWRGFKDDDFDKISNGPFMLCMNRPSYLPLFLNNAALEVEAAAHEVSHLSGGAIAQTTTQTIQSASMCGSPQSLLQLTLERLEVRYAGTPYLEALRKVMIHLSMARGGLHQVDLQEIAMSHAFGKEGFPPWASSADHAKGSLEWSRGHWYLKEGWLQWHLFIASLEPLISHVSGRFYLKHGTVGQVVKSRYLSREPYRWALACVHADFFRSMLLDPKSSPWRKAAAARELRDKAALKASGVDLEGITPVDLDYSYSTILPKGGSWICEALLANDGLATNVRSLNLRSNHLQNEGAHALAVVLGRNVTMETLNVSLNQIGDDGAGAIGRALKENTTLKQLTLEGNRIASEGAVFFGRSLSTNNTLFELNLSNNSIGGNGVMAIAQALSFNGCLHVLNLENNSIGPDGAVALGRALEVNDVLRKLGVAHNRMRNSGYRALIAGLETNTTLTSLTAHGNSVIGAHGEIKLQNMDIADMKQVAVPNDNFQNDDERHDMSISLESDESGLGIVAEDAAHSHAFPKIVRIQPGTAAWKEPRIKVGLRVRSINGVRAVGMTGNDVTRRCRIAAGKHIRLELAPPIL